MKEEELKTLLNKWGEKYKINTQLEIVRGQLSEPLLVRTFNDFYKNNQNDEYYINYSEIHLEDLISFVVDKSSVEGYLIIALYFVIDVTSLFYNYQNINFEQIDSFYSISNISCIERDCTNLAFMLEHGFDINRYFKTILNNDIPDMFLFYFLSSLNKIHEYEKGWEFYNFFGLMPDLDIKKARILVRTISGYGNIDKAIDFIRNYSSPDMKIIDNDIQEDLLIELFSTVMERNDGDELLAETHFTESEYNILQNYAKNVVQLADWDSSKFIK